MKLKLFGNNLLILILFSTSLYSETYLGEVSNIAYGFYHNIMSPVKDDVSKCQFYPSCSHFGKDAINEYGFINGILLTSDRLMRCSGGHLPNHSYPKVNKLFYDPPSKNFLFGEGHIWNIGISGATDINPSNLKTQQNDSNIFEFSKFLFLNNDYESSNLELKRISFYNSENNFIQNKVNLLKSINFLRLQNTFKARESINLVSNEQDFSNFNSNIVNFLINDLDNTNSWNINFLNKLINKNDDSLNIYKKLLFYSNYKVNHIISENNELKILMTSLKNDNFDNYESLNNFIIKSQDIDFKSPTIAGIMSTFIPGTGYIYAGKTKEGLSAMLINGLLGAGIYSLFKNKNYGAGVLTSLVAAPFYLGNIIGSVNSVHLHNNKLKQYYLLNLRKELEIDYYFSITFLEYCW